MAGAGCSGAASYSSLTLLGSVGAAAGVAFAWQVQHFDSLGSVGARLVAAGLRQHLVLLVLMSRGRLSTVLTHLI